MLDAKAVEALLQTRPYDLGQPLAMGMPVAGVHPPYIFSLMQRHGDVHRGEGCTSANELIVLSGHTGTHLDGPGHIAHHGMLYGGHAAAAEMGRGGMKNLGMEHVPPLIMRGVMADLPGYLGVPRMSGGEPVGAAQVEACLAAQGVQVQPGDALLLRTGWIQLWANSTAFGGHETGTPGADLSLADWAIAKQVAMVGADTIAFEVIPPNPSPTGPLPVHVRLLAQSGIRILEMVNLEELARDRIYRFILVVLPLKLVGATGSPVRPIALPTR